MRKILIAACLGLVGSASFAQSPVVVEKTAAPFRVISYADLNLASKQGQERLESRIRGAARDLCLEDNIGDLKSTVARRHCYDTAVGDGFRQMEFAKSAGSALAVATLTIRGE